ncbi:hypothetical protein FE79_14965, partial [Staphylococcus aureus]
VEIEPRRAAVRELNRRDDDLPLLQLLRRRREVHDEIVGRAGVVGVIRLSALNEVLHRVGEHRVGIVLGDDGA